ncbi:hypothetical protein DBR11_17340 [Pedobacter sp. HMWF019]|uniref:DUF6266 family protein n=1 Tax=Pedobacter sp. HMWF019 TaxID=2056856 RepID=UPI000D39261A|nr:DUF6266 family protein [Pedobacter sp. HMWF019]PTS97369.1 hypothetical protein DBR11_17340 [Pedobacter sp. HMWF019]
MGKFLKGILGGFSGKIGNVIGAVWRGVDYMRSLPRKSNKPATEAQLIPRLKLKVVVGFLRSINDLIKLGYQSYKGKQTPMNAAVAFHIDKAITGVYPNLNINFPKVVFSKGHLLRPSAPGVESVTPAKIKFEWLNNAPATGSSTAATDMATLLLYNPDKEQFVTAEDVAARSALTFTLSVPAEWIGDDVHCWMSFVSVNRKEVSDSVYVGTTAVL